MICVVIVSPVFAVGETNKPQPLTIRTAHGSDSKCRVQRALTTADSAKLPASCPGRGAAWCTAEPGPTNPRRWKVAMGFLHLSRLRGRSTRSAAQLRARARRVGESPSIRPARFAEAPPPRPSPASGRGGALPSSLENRGDRTRASTDSIKSRFAEQVGISLAGLRANPGPGVQHVSK